MKTATAVRLDSYLVDCPECHEQGSVAHPDTGSLVWDWPVSRETASCTSCRAEVRIPKRLRRL